MGFLSPLKPLLKRLLSRDLVFRLLGPERYVFCYHDVSPPEAPAHSALYSTRPELFRRQIEALSRRFTWVELDELLSPGRANRRIAALTFDDGFRSVRDEALPFLQFKGIPFTVFLCRMAVEHNFLPVTARVLIAGAGRQAEFSELFAGQPAGYDHVRPEGDEAALQNLARVKSAGILDERVYLTAADIRDLHRHGVRFGSHSTSHRMLAACDAQLLNEEIAENQRYLEEVLGIRSEHFAIPFGKKQHYDPAVLAALAGHGYRYAHTTNPCFVADGQLGIPRLVPRIGVTNEDPDTLLFYVNRPLLKKVDL